jgi:hypothetical protein
MKDKIDELATNRRRILETSAEEQMTLSVVTNLEVT